jgi:hypothetical protein
MNPPAIQIAKEATLLSPKKVNFLENLSKIPISSIKNDFSSSSSSSRSHSSNSDIHTDESLKEENTNESSQKEKPLEKKEINEQKSVQKAKIGSCKKIAGPFDFQFGDSHRDNESETSSQVSHIRQELRRLRTIGSPRKSFIPKTFQKSDSKGKAFVFYFESL